MMRYTPRDIIYHAGFAIALLDHSVDPSRFSDPIARSISSGASRAVKIAIALIILSLDRTCTLKGWWAVPTLRVLSLRSAG